MTAPSLSDAKLPYADGFQPAPNEAQDLIFIPYVAWIRVYPKFGQGARRTYIHSLEKMAAAVENALLNYSTPFNIATPVASTVQFADNYARLTIVGFDPQQQLGGGTTPNWDNSTGPTTQIKYIHSGTNPGEPTALRSGSEGGSLSYGQDTLPQTDAGVLALRDALYAAVSPVLTVMSSGFIKDDINAIEYNGVKYGVKKQGGRSFPLP
jgi:hypothetical protein